jgi:hypothetical protein
MLVKSTLPEWFNAWGLTIAPFIFIVPQHIDDAALIAHETVHYKEQLKWLVIPWWIAYLVSSDFRKNAEVRAYKKQISLGGCSYSQAAYWLSTNYRLDITEEEAYKELLRV